MRSSSNPSVSTLWLGMALTALLGACSPDLRETAGPQLAHPNVTGAILRDGAPVRRLKVKLQDTRTGITVDRAKTDAGGRYGFAHVGPGSWVVKVTCPDTLEFATASYGFVFARSDTTLAVPALDVSLSGTRMKTPAADAAMAPPTFGQPLGFEWDPPQRAALTSQARVYDAADSVVWYGAKTSRTLANWNGRGSSGTYTNRPVPPGWYTWRVRFLDPATGAEFTTAPRRFDLLAAAP